MESHTPVTECGFLLQKFDDNQNRTLTRLKLDNSAYPVFIDKHHFD
jgi:hypothetical protein